MIRGFLARRALRIMQLIHVRARGPAAITRLQAAVRGFLVRAKRAAALSKLRNQSAIRIQQAYRRFNARRRVQFLREALAEAAATHGGAVSIQSAWRRYQAQLEVRRRNTDRSVRKIQALARGQSVRKAQLMETRQQQQAAVLIQSMVRQKIAEDEVAARRAEVEYNTKLKARQERRARAEKSALRIQSSFRGHKDRVVVAELRQERVKASAIRIQSGIRGMLGRRVAANLRHVKLEEESAVVIQSTMRAAIARRHVQTLRLDRQDKLRVSSCVLRLFAPGDCRL